MTIAVADDGPGIPDADREADDPAAKTDLPAWCALKSHEFVRMAALPAGWSFLVRRSY